MVPRLKWFLLIGLLNLPLALNPVALSEAASPLNKNSKIQPSIQSSLGSLNNTQAQDISESLSEISQELSNLRPESKWYNSTMAGVIVGAVLGAVLSAVGSRLSKYQAEEKAKIRLSYQVMKEWDDLRPDRNIAYEIFILSGDKKSERIQLLPFSSYNASDRVHVNRVMEFFDRLDLLYRKKLIDREIIVEYLSNDYAGWENDYLSKQREGVETNPKFICGFKGPYEWLLG